MPDLEIASFISNLYKRRSPQLTQNIFTKECPINVIQNMLEPIIDQLYLKFSSEGVLIIRCHDKDKCRTLQQCTNKKVLVGELIS